MKQPGMEQLIGAVFAKYRMGVQVQRARVWMMWPQAVGSELSKLTRVRSLKDKTLYIEVGDSSTAHHLTMQRHHFLKKLQEVIGDDSVTELRFVVGVLPAIPKEPEPEPLPPPDEARAQELVSDVGELSPQLYQSALALAQSLTQKQRWREQQGWKSCPVCAIHSPEVTDQTLCRECTRAQQDPFVQRAALQLERHPEDWKTLTQDLSLMGQEVALYQAKKTLEARLQILALECISDDEYLEFLKEQSRIYLSLQLKLPRSALRQSHTVHLPQNVLRLLNAKRLSADV